MTIGFSTVALLFALVLLLLGLGFFVMVDPYLHRGHRRIMLVIVGLCLALIFQNLWENSLSVGRPNPPLRTSLSIIGYCIRPVFLVLFLHIVRPQERHWPYWALLGLNALVFSTALFSGLAFYIDSDNHYQGGPLANMALYVSAILLVKLFVETMRNSRKTKDHERLIPIIVVAMIVTSVILDTMVDWGPQPITFLTIAIVVSSVFYYVWLHLQFVREHERDLMAAQRIQIMMTQIQPHFLFNALNTIRALYAKDPPLADRTLEDFSTYLRRNLESLDQPNLVPVIKDLEHTRLYAQIETLRFPNVRVAYHIEDESFSIPVLTIQPLVENAIRHGVRGCADGLVTVSTACVGDTHQITVEDNGVGFDPAQLDRTGDTHIGLRNVRGRIEQMCGGTMKVRSETGKGTRITLLIPETGTRHLEERK